MSLKSTRWSAGNSASSVANELAAFVKAARKTLHIAIYDFRLDDPEKTIVVGAIKAAAARGVDVKIAFDHTRQTKNKKDKTTAGNDPAPRGTKEFVEQAFPASSRVKTRPVAGAHLMHDKYIVRDGRTIWTGSANFTNDAWSQQENNVIKIDSTQLAKHYETDFDQLWTTGDIKGTGVNDYGALTVGHTKLEFGFSPGEGSAVASLFVDAVQGAGFKSTVRIATMVLSSGPILGALHDHIRGGGKLTGVYDATQMAGVETQWKKAKPPSPQLATWLEIKAHLVGKHSTPYTPTSVHDFMHNKLLVTKSSVLTGSFNLSHNAESNAENVLAIHDAGLAGDYAKYIDQLIAKYGKHKA